MNGMSKYAAVVFCILVMGISCGKGDGSKAQPGTGDISADRCYEGTVEVAGICYMKQDMGKTFNEIKAECERLHARLPTAAEMQSLYGKRMDAQDGGRYVTDVAGQIVKMDAAEVGGFAVQGGFQETKGGYYRCVYPIRPKAAK